MAPPSLESHAGPVKQMACGTSSHEADGGKYLIPRAVFGVMEFKVASWLVCISVGGLDCSLLPSCVDGLEEEQEG